MRIHHSIVGIILLAALAGCSASSGDGDDTASSGSGAHSLGSRSVPGGTVTVSTAGPLASGAANVFHLTLSPGMPVPTEVAAWVGIAYDPAITGVVATPTLAGSGSYDVTITLAPSLAAGSHVWVRLSFADGSVIETGSGDFLLAGH